jgi:hypothetical protein
MEDVYWIEEFTRRVGRAVSTMQHWETQEHGTARTSTGCGPAGSVPDRDLVQVEQVFDNWGAALTTGGRLTTIEQTRGGTTAGG